MAQYCNEGRKTAVAAQTLYLGASISDFNLNMGWNGQRSQLSVKLVEDTVYNPQKNILGPYGSDIPGSSYNTNDYPDDHFLDCQSDEDCYRDEYALPFDAERKEYKVSVNRGGEKVEIPIKPSQERIPPGKIYYPWSARRGAFVSRYFVDRDPGFFGNLTRIDHEGNYYRHMELQEATPTKEQAGFSYDIINVPSLFKIGNFSFAGIIKNWEKNYDSGGLVYNVDLESIDTILDDCHLILDKHSGSIFSKPGSSFYGGPSYYVENSVPYHGDISQGNIPNVFNIYGFLESWSLGDFGGSNKNDNGISANLIIDALSVLTSSNPDDNSDFGSHLERRRAFSPFGRMLLKVPQLEKSYLRISEGLTNGWGMGFMPVTRDSNGVARHHLCLDLSELPRMPVDYRISESTISIMQLIQKITNDSGLDFYFEIIPFAIDGQRAEIMLKLKTIFRSQQISTTTIKDTMQAFEDVGIPVTSSRIGKEKNDNVSRVMYIGGNQQRLFQAKSHRLGFTQTNYIYNAITNQFVEFYSSYQATVPDKYQEPDMFSTRSPYSIPDLDPRYTAIFDVNQKISDAINGNGAFDRTDTGWAQAGLGWSKKGGNYHNTKNIAKSISATAGTPLQNRFFPLYQDIISPFFGYKAEEDTGAINSSSNVYRKVRPVWMDNWTGQIVVLLEYPELPKTLNVPLYSPYAGSNYFMVSESEIRAAMAGFDSFFTYCLGRIFKPDLFASLYNSYVAAGRLNFATSQVIYSSPSVPTPPLQSVPAPPSSGSTGNNTTAQSFKTFADVETVTGAGDPGNQFLSGNVASPYGVISDTIKPVEGGYLKNFDLIGCLEFIKDLNAICQLLASIGNANYGKKYMVAVPEVYSYQDRQFANIQIPAGDDTISVYKGSGKIFYNYEPATDGAWEEFGNMIDDTIVVGTPSYYSLSDDSGKIKPILGFNASDAYDYFTSFLCSNPAIRAGMALSGLDFGDLSVSSSKAELAYLSSQCGVTYPLIDVASLSQNNFVLKASPVLHPDQHGSYRTTFSRRLYHTASVESDFVFLNPYELKQPRVLVDLGASLHLNNSSNNYGTDPNLTVLATASMEDLCVYLRATATNPLSLDSGFVNTLLTRFMSVQTNAAIAAPSVFESQAKYHSIAPKAAQPYFAAIPLKSNRHTYGPWINYPHIDRSVIFADALSADAQLNAVENMIGGVKVEVDESLVPWNYGGMKFLDETALSKIYSELQYQQIIETATLSIPGIPILGLGSAFRVPLSKPKLSSLKPGVAYWNGKNYTVQKIPFNYQQPIAIPNPAANVPRIGNPTGNPILDLIPETNYTTVSKTYNVLRLVSVSGNEGSLVAPIVSNISCNISPQSVTTSYNFRTYTQKLGFFNKENSDRIKYASLENIKRNKQLSDINQNLLNKIYIDINRANAEQANSQSLNRENFESGFFGTSPTEVLIGANEPFIRAPVNFDKLMSAVRNNKDAAGTQYQLNIGQDPGEGPGVLAAFNNTQTAIPTLIDMRTNKTYVGNFMPKEAISQLRNNYNNKSAMSLDGIFSPVSFYPTMANTTFSLRKFSTIHCTICKGAGELVFASKKYNTNRKPDEAAIKIKCPACSVKKIELASSSTTSSATGESLPPYIITNETDFNTILQFATTKSSIASSAQVDSTKSAGLSIPINQISLQPITVPYGEFRNTNTQTDDRCRHSIRVIARGEVPQKNPQSLENHLNQENYYSPLGRYLARGSQAGHNPDFYGMDLLATNHRRNVTGFNYLMNQRFFGLRGPMVMHGWGYDMEGYPVPNQSDEPLFLDAVGRPPRFKLKVEEIGNFLYKDLKDGDVFYLKEHQQVVKENIKKLVYYTKKNNIQVSYYRKDINRVDWSTPADNLPVIKIKVSNDLEATPKIVNAADIKDNYLNEGDIITKQYTYSGSKWVKGPRSDKFYKNWAERSDLWPVGPLDLRWDGDRSVWTMKAPSAPYKMVYITLEEDLVKEDDFDETYPARGYLDDIEYSKEPLPNGFRRIVYVKDKTGFTAPKGVKLLCRYDSDIGYYEPVSKPTITTTGVISSGTRAKINMTYVQGGRSGIVPVLISDFDNPLNFSVSANQKGIFSYINGKWILTAAN